MTMTFSSQPFPTRISTMHLSASMGSLDVEMIRSKLIVRRSERRRGGSRLRECPALARDPLSLLTMASTK
jgi:hypothetical protein